MTVLPQSTAPIRGSDQYRPNSSTSLTDSHRALSDSDRRQLRPLFLLSSICLARLPVGNSGFLRDTNWWQVSVSMARGLDKTRLAENGLATTWLSGIHPRPSPGPGIGYRSPRAASQVLYSHFLAQGPPAALIPSERGQTGWHQAAQPCLS
ncbi:hypothetical protein A4R35_04910 [Thermogemmatispora tikiterensis]|uniref:Uncharacterized protein n=1 Tax=Thermogemmatispora tikiterensis TaxID=1825093 RepID=A0A328VAZ5_9CHLR|nr:hypothetical protein A4R35_04910 [Thermogemmatispora tikiterensis]